MAEHIAVALVEIIPAVLWVGFAALVYLTLRRALLPQLGRLSSLKTPVMELSFAEKLLEPYLYRLVSATSAGVGRLGRWA